MATTGALEEENKESNEWDEANDEEECSECGEDHVRLKHNIATHYRLPRGEHVVPDVFEQARLACFLICFNLDARNFEPFVAGLDDCFHAVAKRGNDIEPHERVA